MNFKIEDYNKYEAKVLENPFKSHPNHANIKFKTGISVIKDFLKGKIVYYIYDKEGNLKITCDYEYVDNEIYEGLIIVKNKNQLYGAINLEGKEVIPCEYRFMNNFRFGIAETEDLKGNTYYIDPTGKKFQIKKHNKYIGIFSESLAPVRNEKGLWGFIDKTGNEVIPCKYKTAFIFQNGVSIVSNKLGLYGIIDKTGKEIVSCIHNNISIEKDGIVCIDDKFFTKFYDLNDLSKPISKKAKILGSKCKVSKSNDIYIIKEEDSIFDMPIEICKVLDKNLNEILNFCDDKYRYYDCNKKLLIVHHFSKFGIIDIFGNEIIPIENDCIEFLPTGHILIKNNGYYILDSNLNKLFPNKKNSYFINYCGDGIVYFQEYEGNDFYYDLNEQKIIYREKEKVIIYANSNEAAIKKLEQAEYVPQQVKPLKYYSHIELDDLDIEIEADSEEERKYKKLETLRIVKAEIQSQAQELIEKEVKSILEKETSICEEIDELMIDAQYSLKK